MSCDSLIKCRICGNTQGNKCHYAKEMMIGTRDTFEYLECAICGCIQLKDIPKNLAAYYPDNYYSFELLPQSWSGYPGNWSNKKWKVAVKRRMLKMIISGLPGSSYFMRYVRLNKEMQAIAKVRLRPHASILDVGCGRGWLLYTLRELGYKRVFGVDPFIQNTIEYDNGLIVQKASLRECNIQECDLVMFHHSFEHSLSPYDDLRAAFRTLRKGGVCLIRIPLASSWAWRHYQTNWVQLDAPRHIHLPTVKSIEIMAKKTGFHLAKVVYDSSAFQIWGSEQYAQNISLEESQYQAVLFNKKTIAEFQERAEQLNAEGIGDQAAFYLIRR